MNIEQQIHDLAAKGYSRQQVSTKLAIPRSKFAHMLKLMPPMPWPGPNKSLAHQEVYSRKRGRSWTTDESKAKAKAALVERTGVMAFGIKDTLNGHAKRHGLPQGTVWRRVKKYGWGIELALSTLADTRGGVRKGQHDWRRAK